MKNILPVKNIYSDKYLLCSVNTHRDNILTGFYEVLDQYKNIKTIGQIIEYIICLIKNLWLLVGQWDARDMYLVDSQGTKMEGSVFHGADLYSCNDGVVIATGKNNDCGNYIIVKQKVYEYVLYCHLVDYSILVQEGQEIKQGQRIAKCGNTGHSTSPHLHIGFYFNDPRLLNWNLGIGKKFTNFSNRVSINIETGETFYNCNETIDQIEIIAKK